MKTLSRVCFKSCSKYFLECVPCSDNLSIEIKIGLHISGLHCLWFSLKVSIYGKDKSSCGDRGEESTSLYVQG